MDLFKGLLRVRSIILIADHLTFHENELLIHKRDLEVKRVPGGNMIPLCDGKRRWRREEHIHLPGKYYYFFM